MNLVEQRVIKPNHKKFREIEILSFASKNLYNAVNFQIRQTYFLEHRYLKLSELWPIIKSTAEYKSLPRKVSNQVIRDVYKDWSVYYQTTKIWKSNPGKFKSKPRIPGYKSKKNGRHVLTYEKGAINIKKLKKEGIISPSQLDMPIKTNKKVKMVRIVPRRRFYILELIYEKEPVKNENLNKSLIMGIDLGLNNLATLTSNKSGFRPRVVNGRPLKSQNQYFNKQKAYFQSKLSEQNQFSSRRLDALATKRNRKINHFLHIASKAIIDLCIKEDIGIIVIGKNDEWKQNLNLGKSTNQNFSLIPFNKFIHMLCYKSILQGIDVILTEESYTSKCSFYDQEQLQHTQKYLGIRKGRFYRRPNGQVIHADVQGSLNIIRKVFPSAFDDFYKNLSNVGGIVDALSAHPLSMKLCF